MTHHYYDLFLLCGTSFLSVLGDYDVCQWTTKKNVADCFKLSIFIHLKDRAKILKCRLSVLVNKWDENK